jgi:hypothetical protein
MAGIFIHQILTPLTSPDELDPGFIVLDNRSNERPDWYEYWPIRRFLLNEPMEEDSFYGFLSPKFKQKTNLSSSAARAFVGIETAKTDVVLLSPSLQWTAYHLNVFQFGDVAHPGLLSTASRFFERIGHATNLDSMVTTSRNEVYSNYIVAKPRFWRAWLDVTERLFAIAESSTDPLGDALRAPTTYRGGRSAQMKVFIVERIATWMLAGSSNFVARARDPFIARSRIYKLPFAIVCDALKIAYLANGRQEGYKDVFMLLSRMGKLFGWQMRIGNALGFENVRSYLKKLASRWDDAGRS